MLLDSDVAKQQGVLAGLAGVAVLVELAGLITWAEDGRRVLP
jgi:hypothetical protein